MRSTAEFLRALALAAACAAGGARAQDAQDAPVAPAAASAPADGASAAAADAPDAAADPRAARIEKAVGDLRDDPLLTGKHKEMRPR